MTSTCSPIAALPPFRNEAIKSFTESADQRALSEAIAELRTRLGRFYPVVIDGRPQQTEERILSRNPARPDEIIGEVGSATLEQAMEALAVAERRYVTWSRQTPQTRAHILLAAAARLREERARFNALLVLEVGKPWIEADADTAETIDFLEYYAREALRYAEPPPLVAVPGERGVLRYLPLGVGLIIPPWNFPLAITAGMTAAAIVCGNTVILKPSSESPVIAAAFVELLHEVGLPPGVVNFVPGAGSVIGDPLVSDPRTRFIAFTGSKEVGLHINTLAARHQPGQRWIKRVVAEMGGKDAILVCDDADLDAAADGIVASAFGFSGQKCSACSRLILDERIADEVLHRCLTRIDALVVGDPTDRLTQMGPVINEAARTKMLAMIRHGKTEGRLICGGEILDRPGFFLAPTVFTDVMPDSRLAQEEIFGPVLAVLRARDFDHALELANASEYGLTGAAYSRDPERLQQIAERFFVGNLYLNRKCTGALVGAHPFGGFHLSGTDSKAGGSDYLGLFLQAQVIAERL